MGTGGAGTSVLSPGTAALRMGRRMWPAVTQRHNAVHEGPELREVEVIGYPVFLVVCLFFFQSRRFSYLPPLLFFSPLHSFSVI